MKKILLFFAAMCCMMVTNAQQFEDANGIKYNVTSTEDKTVEVISKVLFGYSGAVVIPTTVTYGEVTYSVTRIGEQAFENCQNLTSVILPNSVTSIGLMAFFSCTGLKSINIPSSITIIDDNAFSFCESLISITIPISVTNINVGVFRGCKNLTSIIIPSNVTKIEPYAFYGCISLTSVTIPNKVTSIGFSAFYGCTGLKSITVLPSTPPELDDPNVFDNVTKYIPVFVSDDAYSVVSWGGFTNFQMLDINECKQTAIFEINIAKERVPLSNEETVAINGYISAINNVTELSDVNLAFIENAKNAALAIINQVEVKIAREDAIAAIGVGGAGTYLTELAQQYIGIINAATDVTTINNAKNAALETLKAAKGAYNAGKVDAFGSLGEKQNGPAIEVIKDGERIILYRPDRVNFIKAYN